MQQVEAEHIVYAAIQVRITRQLGFEFYMFRRLGLSSRRLKSGTIRTHC
jgi:hypothetical protein